MTKSFYCDKTISLMISGDIAARDIVNATGNYNSLRILKFCLVIAEFG